MTRLMNKLEMKTGSVLTMPVFSYAHRSTRWPWGAGTMCHGRMRTSPRLMVGRVEKEGGSIGNLTQETLADLLRDPMSLKSSREQGQLN